MNFKQITLSVITLFFAVYIQLTTAYAQEASASAIASSPSSIDYQLPYPGMLPDNPLYFLKVFRDTLTSFFMNKPLDKANFDLLQSDKNVEASYLLVTQEQGKTALAFQTFSQAQDYFDQAINQAENAKNQGYSTQDLIKNLTLANQKHEQILEAIAQQTDQINNQTFKSERNREKTFMKRMRSLSQ
jgi:hypothetical protein